MTSDELCDLLVTHFNGLTDSPIEFQAEHPETVAESYAEIDNWRVFILPFEELEEPIDLGNETCREEITPSVVINGPIDDQTTKNDGLALQKFLRESLKGVELSGLLWAGNEVPTVCDTEALKKRQFLSVFRPTFYEFA